MIRWIGRLGTVTEGAYEGRLVKIKPLLGPTSPDPSRRGYAVELLMDGGWEELACDWDIKKLVRIVEKWLGL